jgi:outer membrane protein OmpA-like peptidoglycan-associated protein/uncharacterized protein YegP (UPF0339 family)
MVQEDYLKFRDYEGHDRHPKESDFSTFFHKASSRYFFALLDKRERVLLISEGYSREGACENGIQSVKKNRKKRKSYSVKQDIDGSYYVSLRAANNREIARSAPCVTETAAMELIPYVTGQKVRTPRKAETARRGTVEDDYLVCSAYRGYPGVGADFPGLVKFTHKNGKHYFAWYDARGEVLMRSEGYPRVAARNSGMASVARNRDIEKRYSVEKVRGAFFAVLRAGNRQEIARSCPCDSEAAARMIFPGKRNAPDVPLAVVGATTVAAAVAAHEAPVMLVQQPPVRAVSTSPPPISVAAGKKGVPRWLVALPLIAIAVWLLWPKAKPAVPAGAPGVAVTTPREEPPTAPQARKETLHWIFFDFDSADLRAESRVELDRMVSLLQQYRELKGVLKAFTDSKGSTIYNEALSRRRAEAAKRFLIAQGIDPSRIEIEFLGMQDPIAKESVNGQDSEQGRQLNRRVELHVQGAEAKRLVVESAPPVIARDLKAN